MPRGGAVGAADAGIILIVQRVIGNFVDFDVGPDIGPRPSSQRIDFDQFKFLVPLDQPGIRTGRSLVTPDPGNPCVVSFLARGSVVRLSAAGSTGLDCVPTGPRRTMLLVPPV